MEPRLCFIKESYFLLHPEFVKVLDPNNSKKQSKRTHLCLEVVLDQNQYFIPLRNNLGDPIRKYGRIGHKIPSKERPRAGLDYRYALIVNEEKYIEEQKELKIPKAQYKILRQDIEIIEREFTVYLRGYIKSLKKGRQFKEPLFRESSLINFQEILLK